MRGDDDSDDYVRAALEFLLSHPRQMSVVRELLRIRPTNDPCLGKLPRALAPFCVTCTMHLLGCKVNVHSNNTGDDVYNGKTGQAPNVRYNGRFRYSGHCL